MELRVLGPVEATADRRALPLGGTKQRSVLAMLVLDANRTVSADRLVEGLWGEHPPASAPKMIQNYVWRLRGVLANDSGAEILTHGRGYELRIDPDAVDVRRFQRLLSEASRANNGGARPAAAREALALWRGPALADVADEPFAAPEIRRLEELRLEAAELAIDADLQSGRQLEALGEIEALVAAHPLYERFHAQRMLALYRCGRQADALEAFREARGTLVEEIGVEPGRELRELHEAILAQDPSLEVEPAIADLPRELDASSSPPLAGRAEELTLLRAQWQRAQLASGGLVAIAGARGMGKTRLAAEIAGIAHGEGATVLHAAGAAAPEVSLAAIARARAARRPTLLVVDDADRAGGEVRAAMGELGRGLEECPSLVVATGCDEAVLAGMGPRASIELPPLDGAAVRRIAALYAPEAAPGELPVDALLASSGGVPSRVHALANDWAREEAARRVDAVAGLAAAGRVEARALVAELAGSVAALQSMDERAERLAAPDGEGPVVCPFKGLAHFDVHDAEYFFGREQLVAQLVARLVGTPLIAIAGPSGSGKSSALRAGLLPALAAGVLPGSEGWEQVLIRPGEHPARELRRVTYAPHTGRLVLAIDQFEEMFTACRDESERQAFVAGIARAAEDPQTDMVVVLALRAGFYARCAAYPELARLMGANSVLVGPMSRDELRRAISRPAARVGLRVDPDLEDALVADVEGQPGALPLLSSALLELWQQRSGRRLELAAYRRSGGVRGAVARLAEDAFGSLEPAEQDVARGVLLRLAGEDEDGAIVRRRVALTELDAQRSDGVAHVLDVLAGRRLVAVSAGSVEVAHEALLREWPRLRGWLQQDAEGRRLHRHLGQAAREWEQGGRDRAELYRGARLASALEWRGEHEPELNAAEQAFLDASRAASGRARRRMHLVLAGMVGLLLLASVAAVVALDGRERARDQARAAEAQRVGVQALNEPTLDRSLLLARQAVELDDTPATRGTLVAALRRSPAAIGTMRGDGDASTVIAMHPFGRLLAVGDVDGTVNFLDSVTRQRIGRFQPAGANDRVTSVAFSPDGSRMASAGVDSTGSFVELYDTRTRRSVTRLTPADPKTGIETVAFSPDSRVVVAQTRLDSGLKPNRLLRWDARNGNPIGGARRIPGRRPRLLGFLPGGRMLVTTSVEDGATVVRDAASLRAVRSFPVAAGHAALSPRGKLVAFGSQGGTVTLLDLRTGAVRSGRGRHEGPVTAIGFNDDGRRLVTAGRDERLIVWDPRRAVATETLQAGRGLMPDLAVAPDARTAFSAGRDGTVVAWDLDGGRRLDRPFAAPGTNLQPRSVAAPAHGSLIAVTDAGGFVDLFDTEIPHLAGRLRTGARAPGAAAVAPDGRTLAVIDGEGELGVWDLRTLRPLAPPQAVISDAEHGDAVLTYSADGRRLATGGGGNMLRLWDTDRHVTLNTLPRGVADLSFSHDGRTLAVTLREANFGGGLEILSVPDLEVVRTVRAPIGALGRFTADGRSFVYGDRQGRVWVYDTATWKPRGRPLLAHGPLTALDTSHDGRLLATTSIDGTTRLWDLAAGEQIGPAMSSGQGDMVGAAFVGDGEQLALMHTTGGVLADLRPASWKEEACDVVRRTLTRAEWESVLPDRPYAPACG